MITCRECQLAQVRADYTGETSRTAYLRGKEHLEGLKNKNSENALWKHCVQHHGGQTVEFSMKVLRSHRSPLTRQIQESVEISNSQASVIMNSKGEWNGSKIPRIVIEVGKDVLEEDDEDIYRRLPDKDKKEKTKERWEIKNMKKRKRGEDEVIHEKKKRRENGSECGSHQQEGSPQFGRTQTLTSESYQQEGSPQCDRAQTVSSGSYKQEGSPQYGRAQTASKCGTAQLQSDKATNQKTRKSECGPAQPSKPAKSKTKELRSNTDFLRNWLNRESEHGKAEVAGESLPECGNYQRESTSQSSQTQTLPKCCTVRSGSEKMTNQEISNFECGPAQSSKNVKNWLRENVIQPRRGKIAECAQAQSGSGQGAQEEHKSDIKENLPRKRRREPECGNSEAQANSSLPECGNRVQGEWTKSYPECGIKDTEPKVKIPKLHGEVPRLAKHQADKRTQAARANKLGLSCAKKIENDGNRREKDRKSMKNREKWNNDVKVDQLLKRKPEVNKFKSKNIEANSTKRNNFRGANKMGENVTKITKIFEKLQTKNEAGNRVQPQSNLTKPKLIGGGEIISGQKKGGGYESGGGEGRCVLDKGMGGRGEAKTALDKGVGE